MVQHRSPTRKVTRFAALVVSGCNTAITVIDAWNVACGDAPTPQTMLIIRGVVLAVRLVAISVVAQSN
jgi:hypothetical protein